MRLKKGIIGLFALVGVAALAGCSSGNTATSQPQASPSAQSSSEPLASSSKVTTFVNMTLSQVHDHRVANTLRTLDQKAVIIKGKVTYVKRVAEHENDSVFFIQSGKYAVEVNYPSDYTVNVGDSVEVKGQFGAYALYDTTLLKLYVDHGTNPSFDVKVINESISVENVTITKEADLIEYCGSTSSTLFTVTSNRTNAAFVGTLSDGTAQIIVANKAHVAEAFDTYPYAVGDNVTYNGVFTYAANEETKVLRYYDRDGLSKNS